MKLPSNMNKNYYSKSLDYTEPRTIGILQYCCIAHVVIVLNNAYTS